MEVFHNYSGRFFNGWYVWEHFSFVGKHASNKQTWNPKKEEQRTQEKIKFDWMWHENTHKMRTNEKNKGRKGVGEVGCTWVPVILPLNFHSPLGGLTFTSPVAICKCWAKFRHTQITPQGLREERGSTKDRRTRILL